MLSPWISRRIPSVFSFCFINFHLLIFISCFIHILLSRRTWSFMSTFSFLTGRQNVLGSSSKCFWDDHQDREFYTNWPNWADNQIFCGDFWAPLRHVSWAHEKHVTSEKSIVTAGRNKFIKTNFLKPASFPFAALKSENFPFATMKNNKKFTSLEREKLLWHSKSHLVCLPSMH